MYKVGSSIFVDLSCMLLSTVALDIENKKITDNTLSLNDLIDRASKILKNEYVRKQMKSRYKYVFIDEYQDTNKPQFELTKGLIDTGIKAFLVGDERQAIYGFRGSDIKNSQNMSKYIEELNGAKISLNENFRSDPSIINTINDIFSSDFDFKGNKLNFDSSPLLIPNKNKRSEENPIFIANDQIL